jgi:hypothetical protein
LPKVKVIAVLSMMSSIAAAQTPRSAGVSLRDSAAVLRSAKSAQTRFESRRRFLAPHSNAGSDGKCQLIGRFCRYSSGLPLSQIPAEPAGTTRARGELLQVLSSAAAKFPGDGWVAGQRVRYLIEAGNDSAALGAAQSCRAEQWWCDALIGLALHTSNRFVAAEKMFARSLQEMPAATRCEWTDLSLLLDADALDAYRRLGCSARESANRRIWWLADPLFSTPGNERRTEHFARRVWAEIERGGSNGFGMRWASDVTEMIVRFGWAEKWTQQTQSEFAREAASYVGHEREPDFHFLSPLPFGAPLAVLGDSSWKLFEEEAPEGYSPRYASSFRRLDPQVARFRRGDSTLIVAAFDVTSDTAWKDIGVHPALVVAPSDTTRFLLAVFDSSALRGAVWITTPSQEEIASLELLSLDGKVAGRWRSGVRPLSSDTTARAISDMLLFDASDSLATDVEGAIETAYGNNVLAQQSKVGVYWETYGDVAADSARTVSMTLTPIAPGVVTRVLRSIGVGKNLAPVGVRWSDAGAGSSVQPHSVLLDLSQVAPGRYDLRIGLGDRASQTPVRIVQVR